MRFILPLFWGCRRAGFSGGSAGVCRAALPAPGGSSAAVASPCPYLQSSLFLCVSVSLRIRTPVIGRGAGTLVHQGHRISGSICKDPAVIYRRARMCRRGAQYILRSWVPAEGLLRPHSIQGASTWSLQGQLPGIPEPALSPASSPPLPPQALLKMDCQGLVVRLIQDFVLLTTAVEVAQRWRELAEKLAKVSKQQMDAYESPHRDRNGVVDSEVSPAALPSTCQMQW